MNNIFLTGDKHGRFSGLKVLVDAHGIDDGDYIVILGDSGLNYYDGKEADRYKNRLNTMGPKLLVVRGNHEARPKGTEEFYDDGNISGCFMRDTDDSGNIRFENIFYMLDGAVYTLKGKSVLVIGGAYSVDKDYRLEMKAAGYDDYRWFQDEQLTEEERNDVMNTIIGIENVDYVFTHTCPARYIPTDMFMPGIDQSTVDNTMENFLDEVNNHLTFDKWYCGHWHTDRIVNNMRFMYRDIVKLGEMY